ncbi:MAG: hypothetical protein WBS14_13360, partial [Rhodomicrobium sp.]
MTDRLLPEMAEATRLTGLGKLMEATALIQRVLWGGSSTGAGDSSDAEDTVAESEPPDEAAEPRSKTPHADRPHASLKETVERVGAMTKSFEEGLHPGPKAPEGASFTTAAYTNAAGSRKYKLYVPTKRNNEQRALIVMLHGCAQT